MKPSKTADSKVDWGMWTQWTLALRVEELVMGPAYSSKKVAPMIITQIDEEKIEIEK